MRDRKSAEAILCKTEPVLKQLRQLQKRLSKKIKHQETDPIFSTFQANACIEEAIWGLVYCQKSMVSTIDILDAQHEKAQGGKKKKDIR